MRGMRLGISETSTMRLEENIQAMKLAMRTTAKPRLSSRLRMR